MEKSKVLIKFLLNFRQSGDVLFFLNVRRLRGYTATILIINCQSRKIEIKLSEFLSNNSPSIGKFCFKLDDLAINQIQNSAFSCNFCISKARELFSSFRVSDFRCESLKIIHKENFRLKPQEKKKNER